MVNQGEVYVQASESMFLYPGDRLMALNGGSAQVNYANGCIEDIGGNEVAHIGTPSSCDSMAAASVNYQVGSTGTSGGGFGSGIQPIEWAGIVGIGAMTGYIVYEGTQSNSSRPPASP